MDKDDTLNWGGDSKVRRTRPISLMPLALYIWRLQGEY